MREAHGRNAAEKEGPIVVARAHGQSLLLHVEAVPRSGETVLAAGHEEPVDGGKATNQAVAAALLGAPVRLVTMLGNDERGHRWRQILKGYGVDVQYLIEADGATDVGFVMLPPDGIPAIASGSDLGAALDGDAVLSVSAAFTGASVVVCQLEALAYARIAVHGSSPALPDHDPDLWLAASAWPQPGVEGRGDHGAAP